MPQPDTTFAEALTRLRRKANLTQRQLADATGLTQPYVSMLESGARDAPAWPVVVALADALGCKTDAFRG